MLVGQWGVSGVPERRQQLFLGHAEKASQERNMRVSRDQGGSRKWQEHSWMAARGWPAQHLGAEGRVVWKKGRAGTKESVWKLVTSSKR